MEDSKKVTPDEKTENEIDSLTIDAEDPDLNKEKSDVADKQNDANDEDTDEQIKFLKDSAMEKSHKEDIVRSSLDSLLYDSEDDILLAEPTEEGASYEEFLAEYHQMLSKTLSVNKEEHTEEDKPSKEEAKSEEDDESDILIPLPDDKPVRISSAEGVNETKLWDKEVSLSTDAPTQTEAESEILLNEESNTDEYDSAQEADDVPSYIEDDEDFQLSFTFEEPEDLSVPLEDEESDLDEIFEEKNSRAVDWVFEIVEMLVFTFAIVILLTTFVFKHSVVKGDSMRNTLENGDRLIVSDLFYTPERGDIIVFEDYSTTLHEAVVKRVIAVEGDTVRIELNGRKMTVYVNENEITEDYVYFDPNLSPYGNGTWVVGENEVFVMGDNRYNSKDSRNSGVGLINVDCILGKVLFRFYPFDKLGGVD